MQKRESPLLRNDTVLIKPAQRNAYLVVLYGTSRRNGPGRAEHAFESDFDKKGAFNWQSSKLARKQTSPKFAAPWL